MAQLLTDLLAAGLIEKLDGDDERFEKMERAAKAVAEELRAKPPQMIRAILAGLDPDVPADDPAIAQAHRALVAEWKSMSSVYTSPPVGLLRAILLDACTQAGEGRNAAILWLTATDTLPLVRLGKEEAPVRQALKALAERTETVALAVPEMPANRPLATPKMSEPAPAVKVETTRIVDRQSLLMRVAATVGPNYRNTPLQDANQHSPRDGVMHWSWDFAERMHKVLADELDAIAADVDKSLSEFVKQSYVNRAALLTLVKTELAHQQQWIQSTLESSARRQQAEQHRLNALWWSEALYSPSLRCGYRELKPQLAAVVMAIDLLKEVSAPSPASVSYLLAETVHRLPAAGFDQQCPLQEILGALREARSQLPNGWLDDLDPATAEGRLSLRDLIVLALGDRELNLTKAMQRAGLRNEIAMNLPALARAVFRQEQAVQIATRGA